MSAMGRKRTLRVGYRANRGIQIRMQEVRDESRSAPTSSRRRGRREWGQRRARSETARAALAESERAHRCVEEHFVAWLAHRSEGHHPSSVELLQVIAKLSCAERELAR